MAQTNSLVHHAQKKNFKGTDIYVTIRLNDECGNGHQDFSITASIYEAGKPHTDRYLITCGCCHKEIVEAFPEFKMFIDLHLSDYNGYPMYTISNGLYHIQNSSKAVAMDYLRCTEAEYDLLRKADNEREFAVLLLYNTDLLKRWNAETNRAIASLEAYTGDTFIVDSVKTQLVYDAAQVAADNELMTPEYFSDAAVQGRRQSAKQKAIADKIADMQANYEEKLRKEHAEHVIKTQIVALGFTNIYGVIVYDHNKTVKFNWNEGTYSYRFTPEDIALIKSSITLPDGYVFQD